MLFARMHVMFVVFVVGPMLVMFVVLQKEIAKRCGRRVTAAGTQDIYYVKSIDTAEGKEHEVDLRKGLTSVECCAYVSTYQLPCRHCIPVFYKREMLSTKRKSLATVERFWPKHWQT